VIAPRRIGIGLILACVAVLGAGCAAGQQAETAHESPAMDAAVASDIGSLALRAIAIQPPQTGTSYPKGASAPLTAVFVNNGTAPERLSGVSTTAATGWKVQNQAASAAGSTASPAAGTSVVIPAGGRVGFGVPNSTQVLSLTGLTDTLFTAQTVKITFTFANAGSTTIAVPVQLSRQAQSSFLPSVPVTPSQTESATSVG
jgi:copper(I)-binding protein